MYKEYNMNIVYTTTTGNVTILRITRMFAMQV